MKKRFRRILSLLLSATLSITITIEPLLVGGYSLDGADLLKVENTEFEGGYTSPEYECNYIYPEQMLEATEYKALPRRYDGRELGFTTNVGNQGRQGLCWAFTATAMAESYMLKNNLGERDFSELHMGYSTAATHVGTAFGPRANAGDGGNRAIVISYLMRGGNLSGLVLEEDDPFEEFRDEEFLERELSITTEKKKSERVENIILISGTKKEPMLRAKVKKAISDYGSVGASMYWSGGEPVAGADKVGSSSYNPKTFAYFLTDGPTKIKQNGEKGPSVNHGINVVGWDDDFPRENFNTLPKNNGAWLVKNSWGEGFGDKGYFWISYEDTNAPIEIYAFDKIRPYDRNVNTYEYDLLPPSGVGVFEGVTTQYCARVFTTTNNGERLEQAAVFVPSSGVEVSVDVVPNFKNANKYNINDFNEKGKRFFEYPGYYTIDLPNAVELGEQGSKFMVVMRVSASTPESAVISYDSTPPKEGTSYRYTEYNDALSLSPFNFCIKAITTRTGATCLGCRERPCICVRCIYCKGKNAVCTICGYCLDCDKLYGITHCPECERGDDCLKEMGVSMCTGICGRCRLCCNCELLGECRFCHNLLEVCRVCKICDGCDILFGYFRCYSCNRGSNCLNENENENVDETENDSKSDGENKKEIGMCIICRDCEECCDYGGLHPGYITGNIKIGINDALELLMYLCDMPQSILFEDERAFKAAKITNPEGESPTIDDVLQILMYLSGMRQSIIKKL